MCEYTRQEFVSGLLALGIDTVEKFRAKVPFMRSELKDEQKFCEIYNFAFGWAKEKGQKSMALDTAIGMWQLLFEVKEWPLVEPWCQFLQAKHNKAISRDTWSQLLEFAREILKSLWYATYPGQELYGLVSDQWKEMGWQGRDPSTDFRGAGFISLENLLFFAKTFKTSFQHLVQKEVGKRAAWEYPFAVAGVNITFMIMQMLDLDATKPRTLVRAVFLQMLSGYFEVDSVTA